MKISQHVAENTGPFCFFAFQLKARTERNWLTGGGEADSGGGGCRGQCEREGLGIDGNLHLIMVMYHATERGKVKHDAGDPTPLFFVSVFHCLFLHCMLH